MIEPITVGDELVKVRSTLMQLAETCNARGFDLIDNSTPQRYWYALRDEAYAAVDSLDNYRASAATVAEPGACEPPLGGRWHHGNGGVVCGTLRIFGEDFDTDPAQDFKESILTWVCDTLNAAQDAYRAAQSAQRAEPGGDVRSDSDKLNDLLNAMDDAGFTQSERNNARMRKAALHLLAAHTQQQEDAR